jgi:hypothetical protein
MEQAEALTQYKKYVKDNPSEKEGARRSFYNTFQVDPEGFSKPKTAFQQQAASRKAGIGVEQAAATMESEIGTAKGKAAGDIGKGVALGAAALGTGGLALLPAAGLMGAAGVGGATLDETLKAHFGSEDLPKSGKSLGLKLGLEGALSAAGEAGMRAAFQGVGYLAKEAFPVMVMRSAAKAQEGQNLLKRVQQNSIESLRTFVQEKGTPTVSIGDDIATMFSDVRKHVTGTSKVFKEATKPVFAKLWKAAERTNGSLDQQPLDALMEIKSDLSHITYKTPGMNTDEFTALEKLTKAVDSKITSHLDKLGGSAVKKVWTDYKAFTEQIKKDDDALTLAASGVTKIMGKALSAVPGVESGIDVVVRGKLAPWALQHLFSNEKTAALVKKAVNLKSIGKHGPAQAAFEAAINTSDVGTLLKDWMKPPKQENPNAAQEK